MSSRAVRGSRQPIDPPRRITEQRRLLGCRRAGRHQLEGVPQYRVAGRQLVDREVAFEHAALGAEGIYAGLDPWLPGVGDLDSRITPHGIG